MVRRKSRAKNTNSKKHKLKKLSELDLASEDRFVNEMAFALASIARKLTNSI